MLLELFRGIGCGLVGVLQARIKVKRYIYVDVDDTARQVAKQHARKLRTQFQTCCHFFPCFLVILLCFQKIIFTGLVMWTWLLQGGLIRACKQNRAHKLNGLQDDRFSQFYDMIWVSYYLQISQR